MKPTQLDLFAQDTAARNALSDTERAKIRARLEATIARLQAADTFPWRDTLECAMEENRFEYHSKMLGDEGDLLWARFDKEMDRLYATLPET